MYYKINDYNKINDKIIDDKIFQEELIEWKIRDREDIIDNLIDWISEATNDKEIMKEDLKYLMSLDDKYILSSISTNEYLTEKDGQEVLADIYNYKI